MRIFYIGSAGPLSMGPFHQLLSSGHDVCGVGLDREMPAGWLPQTGLSRVNIESNALALAAAQYNLSLLDLREEPASVVVRRVKSLAPDLILVSCYARKLPDDLLQAATFGGVNCHPSLLPAYRGPAPLFWQYRDGVDPLGISLHYMNGEWDSGDIIASTQLKVVDGLPNAQIQQDLSTALCQLLDSTLDRFPDGLNPVAQAENEASYYGYPEPSDFQISSGWSARRIFNFMRATEHWGRPYPCEVNGRNLELKRALHFSNNPESRFFPENQDVIRLECNPGVLLASYYH